MRIVHPLALVASSILLAGPLAAEVPVSKRLARMTAESFHSTAEVRRDPLEFVTIISTEPGYKGDKLARHVIWSDAHLRAIISNASGATRYELRQELRYRGPRRDFRWVQFDDRGELRRSALSIARHGADFCANSDTNGECTFSKTLAFDVPVGTVRAIARGASQAWAFKFKDETGHDITAAIVPAEAAGLLRAVAAYEARRATEGAAAALR